MEKYSKNNNYMIVNISRSSDALSIKSTQVEKDVNFLLLPYLVVNSNENLATVILTSQFIDENDIPLSNELTVKITYKFFHDLPIALDGKQNINIQNYPDLLSIFDTIVGTFRGILFEWLKDSPLQRPLPFVDIEELIKDLRISFSK